MAAATLFPVSTARRYQAVPVGFVDQQTLLVAMADPANVLAVDDIQMATGLDCRVAVAAEDDIEALLGAPQHAAERRHRGDHRGAGGPRTTSRRARRGQRAAGQRRGRAGDQARLQHPRPGGGRGRLRHPLRARGGRACGCASGSTACCKEAAHVPKRMISAVISRIKIMSDLDIAEKRVPQDGRVSVAVEERRVDLRVTTLPTQRGEGATIRILDNEQRPAHARRARDGGRRPGSASRTPSTRPYGAVLVTGPTGSGKSTTLYAALAASSTRSRRRSSRSRTRSSTGSTGSTRSTSTARPGSTSPPACARSCAPIPTSSWSARSATPRRRGSRSRRR